MDSLKDSHFSAISKMSSENVTKQMASIESPAIKTSHLVDQTPFINTLQQRISDHCNSILGYQKRQSEL